MRISLTVEAGSRAWLRSRLRELISFGCVGLTATATHYGAATLSHLRFEAEPLWANLFGYLAALSISYLGHSLVTFRRPLLDGAQAVRFAVVSLAGLGLSQAITLVGTRVAHLPFKVVLLAVVVIVPVFTFLASRLWAFADRRVTDDQSDRRGRSSDSTQA